MLRTRTKVVSLDDPDSLAAVPSSDALLLERVAGGDRNAFAQLYDRTAGAVYGTARRVVVDQSMAEDITQDVMLTVWSRAGSFDRTRGSARGWILMIAHRRAVSVVRSEQASRNRVERVAGRSADRSFDEVSDTAVDNAERLEVTQALACLTVLQRAAVDLAYYKGLTYREVAQSLDIPLGTAKTRIRDGLRRLRAQLVPSTFHSA